MKRYIYTLLTLVLIAVGCQQGSNEELYVVEQPKGPQFHASFGDDTRIFINEDHKLRWHSGDQISLFVGSTVNKQYQFDGETGDSSGTFSDISSSASGSGSAVACNYAVYPYNPTVMLYSNGMISLILPKEQIYNEGSFGRGANVMVATTANTSDHELMFRNVCSYLRVRLWGENQTVKSITVTSRTNKAIAGNMSLTPRYGEEPICTMRGTEKSVTLTCEDAVEVSSSKDTPTEFWIVIPPVTLESGFTVDVTNAVGYTQTFEVEKSVTFSRNTFYTLTRELDLSDGTTPPNNEIWYTTNDSKTIKIVKEDVFGANIVSNTYADGKGIIKFDGDVTQILYTNPETAAAAPLASISKVEGAFTGNANLETLVLPNSIKVIERCAFMNCKNLISITFPDNLESIDATAVRYCPKLAELKGRYAADGGRYLIMDNTIVLYATGSGTELIIPSGVTAIAPEVFAECKMLTRVVIPDGVTTIGSEAFHYCTAIQTIVIPNSVTSIGVGAFYYCESLIATILPYNLTKIEDRTFYGCKSLPYLTIPKSVVSIGTSAFSGCAALEAIDIPNGVEMIEDYTFYGCKSLQSVSIPKSVTSVGLRAFYNCTSLTSIQLPKSITSIDNYAFEDCSSLVELYCAARTVPTLGYQVLLNTSSNLKIYVPTASVSLYRTSANWSSYKSAITGYDFGDDEDEVPDRDTPNNNEIFYTSSDNKIVTPYDTSAFNGTIVSNLYSTKQGKGVITFNTDVTEIGQRAFMGCSTLTSVKLPDSLKYINMYAFAETGLTSVSLPTNTYGVSDYAFYGCRNLSEVDLNSVIIIGAYAFKDCSLTSVYLPATAESIGNCAFKCSTLMEFKGPNLIGSSKELAIGYSLIQLADGACKNATSYTVPTGVWRIHESVFEGYTKLENVSIPEGVTDIHKNAFRGCTSLKKIILPSTLEWVGNYLLKDCTQLQYIYFKGTTPPVGNGITGWEPCDTWVTLRVPYGSEETYRCNGYWWDYKVEGYTPGDYGDNDDSGDDGGGDDSGDDGGDSGSGDGKSDGDVVVLNKATKGNGIDIIIMGDAYSQSDIDSGKYSRDISKAIDALFAEEPYASFRDMFNVYQVTVVSPYSGYDKGTSALGGYFGNGTLVGGDHEEVENYCYNAIDASRINEALIIVIMNRNYYAGTCYMFQPVRTCDYGTGASISYFPLGTSDAMLGQIIRHEAGGHGFAKLGDEYFYESMGTIPASEVASAKQMRSDWGWFKNVDFIGNENLVYWSKFINDTRYYFEGIGAYEGAYTYYKGAWRPTYNSIMNDNTGGYNAPSREAIYYRIHKLAYGSSWTYSYESFVTWDAKNRIKSFSVGQRSEPAKDFVPMHPPVIINKPLCDDDGMAMR